MKIIATDSFKKDFDKFPANLQRKTEKALKLLSINSFYPSLQVKKTKGKLLDYDDVFEGRIDKNHRFLFLIKKDSFILLRCGDHDEFFK